jgi:hypothetical protein
MQAFGVAIGNPKAIIFLTALFPRPKALPFGRAV